MTVSKDIVHKVVDDWMVGEESIFTPDAPKSQQDAINLGGFDYWLWRYRNPDLDDSGMMAGYEEAKRLHRLSIPLAVDADVKLREALGDDDKKFWITEQYSRFDWDARKFIGVFDQIGGHQLHGDIIAAANETGVSPELIYNVGMGEGLYPRIMDNRHGKGVYNQSQKVDTFTAFGAEAFFDEQELILNRGYLGEEITSIDELEIRINESGYKSHIGTMSMTDAWRATGALLRLNEDYLQHHFKRAGHNFDELSEESKNWWIYATYNAGIKDSRKLLKMWGPDPMNNPKFKKRIKDNYQEAILAKGRFHDLMVSEDFWGSEKEAQILSGYKEHDVKLYNWMEKAYNISGGAKITKASEVFNVMGEYE